MSIFTYLFAEMYECRASLAKINILGLEKLFDLLFFKISQKENHPPNDSTLFLSIGVPDGREMPQIQGLPRRDSASKGQRVTYT